MKYIFPIIIGMKTSSEIHYDILLSIYVTKNFPTKRISKKSLPKHEYALS